MTAGHHAEMSKSSLDVARACADRVIASMAGMPAAGVQLFSTALGFSTGPLGRFSTAFHYLAGDIEDSRSTGQLTRLKFAHDLRRAAYFEADAVLDLLGDAEASPWPEIRASIETLRPYRRPPSRRRRDER